MLGVVGQQKLRKIKKQKQLTQNSWWGGRTRKTEEDKETVASNTRLCKYAWNKEHSLYVEGGRTRKTEKNKETVASNTKLCKYA